MDIPLFDVVCHSVLFKEPFHLLLNALNRPSIDPSPEASLSGMMEGRSDSVGPNEVIDVEALLSTHNLLGGNLLFYKKHLCACEMRNQK
jgi:hypothetical protein